MRARITLKVVDGLGRTVTTTSVAAYNNPVQQERVCHSMLAQVRTRWTHCAESDRAEWGYEAHDDSGHMVSYG